MHGSVFLRDLAWVLAASLPVIFIFRKLKAPSIAAFLVTGMLIGPHALGLVEDPARVSGIAELGVALILFFVGLEFSLARFKTMGRSALVGGSLQMAFAAAATAVALVALRVPAREAIFAGILVSVSPTAVVLPALAARDELGPLGKQFLGIALFQDLAVIPLVLLLPALAPQSKEAPGLGAVLTKVGVAAVGTALLVTGARFFVPRVLDRFVRMAGPETSTAAALVVVLGIVALVETAGASAVTGAFAAGIVLALAGAKLGLLDESGQRLSALMAAGTSDLGLLLPGMAAVRKTLGELRLEEDHVAVPALLRDGVPMAPPALDIPIEACDTLFLVGAHEDLVRATKRLEG